MGFPINERWLKIYKLLQTLDDNGFLVAGTDLSIVLHSMGKRFLEYLQGKGYYTYALIEAPKNVLRPVSSVDSIIVVISKQGYSSKILVASFNETDDDKVVYNNLLSRIDRDNLSEGAIVNIQEFRGFSNYRINKGNTEHSNTVQ